MTVVLALIAVASIASVILLVRLHRRVDAAQSSCDLGFIAGCRKVERGWWLWRSHDLYATVQYTYRGIPFGQPVERHVHSVKVVNDRAIQVVLAAAAAYALQDPAPFIQVLGRLPEGTGAHPSLDGKWQEWTDGKVWTHPPTQMVN